MIRKIGILGLGLCSLLSLISCEEDFKDIGGNVIKNTAFTTNQIELELEISSSSIDSVRADNIAFLQNPGVVPEYWIGVYNSGNYKTVKSSFVSQLGLITNLKTNDNQVEVDSVYTLDEVILKLPYQATRNGVHDDGSPKFVLDSILGNPDIAANIEVFENGTYLSNLDPLSPANSNSFFSNKIYDEKKLLNKNDQVFSLRPQATDTVYTITRHKVMGVNTPNTVELFTSEEKLASKGPFIAIPLKKDLMKELFWDKFEDSEFSSTEQFNNYFRGLYVKATGSNGSLVPLDLNSRNAQNTAAVEFHYTITRFEKDESGNLIYKDTVPSKYSFPLNGIRAAKYDMGSGSIAIPSDNFAIQGTVGTKATVKIIGVNLEKTRQNDPNNPILNYEAFDENNNGYLSLEELSDIKDSNDDNLGILINDASLTFYVNQTINNDPNIVPQRLVIYSNEVNEDNNTLLSPKHIADAYTESALYGGNLVVANDKPEKYTFRITDYISNLLNKNSTNFYPLELRVFNNPTDSPFYKGAQTLDINVPTYNWNPRGVTLLNGNEASHGVKKAVLTLSYSEQSK